MVSHSVNSFSSSAAGSSSMAVNFLFRAPLSQRLVNSVSPFSQSAAGSVVSLFFFFYVDPEKTCQHYHLSLVQLTSLLWTFSVLLPTRKWAVAYSPFPSKAPLFKKRRAGDTWDWDMSVRSVESIMSTNSNYKIQYFSSSGECPRYFFCPLLRTFPLVSMCFPFGIGSSFMSSITVTSCRFQSFALDWWDLRVETWLS